MWGLIGVLFAPLTASTAGCVLPSYAVGDGGGGAGATTITTGGSGGAGGAGATTGTDTTTDTNAAGGTGGMGGTGGTGSTTSTTDPPLPCQSGSQCVMDPPAGWKYIRPLTLPYGDISPTPCPNGAAPAKYYTAPSSTDCNTCFCSWLGAKCSEPEISCYFGNTSCSGPSSFSLTPPSSACVNAAGIALNPNTTASCRITKAAEVTSPGTCSAGTPALKEENPWKVEVRACAVVETPAMGTCTGGMCIAEGSGSFAGALCVQKADDVACPAGWSTRTVVYDDANDTRGCNTCSCGAPTITCGMGTYNVFPGAGCAGAGAVNVLTNMSCANVGNNLSSATRSIKPPMITAAASVSCNGGGPTGSLDPLGPSTICCK